MPLARSLRAFLAVTLLGVLPVRAGAQYSATPEMPRNPTTMAACSAYQDGWRALYDGVVAQHKACLDNARVTRSCTQAKGIACDCDACESLHQQMLSTARLMNSSVDECRASVERYEAEERRREAEEKRRKEEAEERRRAEEERQREAERKARAEEETRRREAEAARQQAEAEKKQREAERTREEANADRDRRQEQQRLADDAVRRQREAAEQAEREAQQAAARDAEREAERLANEERERRDSEERERREREQHDRDMKALDRAIDLTDAQQKQLEQRTAERAAATRQLADEQARRQEEAARREQQSASGAGEALRRMRDALPGPAARQQAPGDPLNGFDMGAVEDRSAKAIDQLIDQGKTRVPFASLPFELIRTATRETLTAPERIFDAIGDMEQSDPRLLDDFIDGYNARVFGPRNFARILGEHWMSGAKDVAESQLRARVVDPVVREAGRRATEAFNSRDPRALFTPQPWSLPTARVQSWWASSGGGDMPRIVGDENGTPLLVDANGKLFRFDATRRLADYKAEEVASLVARYGLRIVRNDPTEFEQHSIVLSPILRDAQPFGKVSERLADWVAGEIVGRAIAAPKAAP